MKTSSTSITNASRNRTLPIVPEREGRFLFVFISVFWIGTLWSHQVPTKMGEGPTNAQSYFLWMEAGLATSSNMPRSIYELSLGEYSQALAHLDQDVERTVIWLRSYLEGLVEVSAPLERHESAHFVLFTPPGQSFLADTALSSLEIMGNHYERHFGHRPKGKVRVEIYATQQDFSKASTLTIPILENSGAIGICKFHRLMILSPQALPFGYRWLDALSHEYGHLMINELTHSKMELWLHEGTARYFDTSYRAHPPVFLTPNQKTGLKSALKEGRLVSFERMSPSMVYLKDQEEVSLAFAQVSHAVSWLIETKGLKSFRSFLETMKTAGFNEAFRRVYHQTPVEFEQAWKSALAQVDWPETRGAMSDTIPFAPVEEIDFIGADAQNQVRLGDRMRMKGWVEPALREYQKALEQEPDNAVILLKVARMQLALNQFTEAVTNLRRAIEKNPNYGTPYLELGGLVEAKEAVNLFLEANAINPFDPRVHAGLAASYKKLGRVKEAEKEELLSRALLPEADR